MSDHPRAMIIREGFLDTRDPGRVGTDRRARRSSPASPTGSSPTPRSASAARPARSPARSGTACRPTICGLTGQSYDNTGRLWRPTPGATSASSRRSAMAGPRHGDAAVPERLADDERRLQALPQRALHGGLPDGRAVPDRVRYGGGAAGHLQRLRLLRAGLPVRRGRAEQAGDGKAHKCTLCYDRLKGGLEPACAKSCPTDSIQFGESRICRSARRSVSRICTQVGAIGLSVRAPGAPGATGGMSISTPSSC